MGRDTHKCDSTLTKNIGNDYSHGALLLSTNVCPMGEGCNQSKMGVQIRIIVDGSGARVVMDVNYCPSPS